VKLHVVLLFVVQIKKEGTERKGYCSLEATLLPREVWWWNKERMKPVGG